MKLLVVTSEPITAAQLREAVHAEADPADIEVMVLAPALAESGIRFWVSDADAAIERANSVRTETVGELESSGVNAEGTTGEGDPMQAIIDALQTFPADRIVLFTHAHEDDQRYREDLDTDELRERAGVPVDRASVAG
jgi:nucleotide-binding universal stress UspA family protein